MSDDILNAFTESLRAAGLVVEHVWTDLKIYVKQKKPRPCVPNTKNGGGAAN